MLKYFAVAFAIAMLALPTSAQDTAKQTEETLAGLRQIRVLLETRLNTPSVPNVVQAQAPTTPVTVDVRNAPFLGSKEAPLTIVEFTDFQCPFCNRFYLETFPDLKKNYIDSLRVRFYGMDFPLDIQGNVLLAARRRSHGHADRNLISWHPPNLCASIYKSFRSFRPQLSYTSP